MNGVNCIVKDGNETFGGSHFVVHYNLTDVELQCSTPKTYIMLYINFTSMEELQGTSSCL